METDGLQILSNFLSLKQYCLVPLTLSYKQNRYPVVLESLILEVTHHSHQSFPATRDLIYLFEMFDGMKFGKIQVICPNCTITTLLSIKPYPPVQELGVDP